MLIAGPTSSCDVCLEPFGRDHKMPCSITCGHVFCVECLDNICPPMCPLCRKSFDPYLTVRLHIDLDSVKAPPSPPAATSDSSNDEEDAKRIYTAITKIATEGCSESHIRGVISEGKTFLNGKPRDSFKDLRTIFRLMSYLTEVKSNLRAARQQNQDLGTKQKILMQEREEILAKVKAQMKKRDQEQKQALDIELNLREHCSKAHEAYERMVEQYNYVAKEWSHMNEEIKRLRSARPADRTAPGSPSYGIDLHYSPHQLDQESLLGAALREGNSILISPLPEFTTKNSAFKPLPRVDEGEEEEESYDGSEEYDEEDSSDGDILPPIMEVIKSPLANADPARHIAHDELAKRPSSSERASPDRFPSMAPTPTKDFFHVPNPSGLSRTAPYVEAQRGGRSRSHSIPSDGSSRSPASSRPSSRSVSPARPSASSSRSRLPAQVSQTSLIPYQSSSQSHSRSNSATSPPPAGDGLRSRLQDILGDASSSSPPQSSSASMAAARAGRRQSASRSPSPSSSDSRRYPNQTRSPREHHGMNNVEHISRMLQSNAPHSGSAPPPSTSPNPRTSSASEAARALERSKRERQQAEREKRAVNERSSPERELEPTPQSQLQRAVHPPMVPSSWVSASSKAALGQQARYSSSSSSSNKSPVSASGAHPQPQPLGYSLPYSSHSRSSSTSKPLNQSHPPYPSQYPASGLYA